MFIKFTRLCEPDSKLGVLRWLETVALPGTSLKVIDHQHLLRAMDALVDFAPDEVIRRYKSLADIERGFRVLKSEMRRFCKHYR